MKYKVKYKEVHHFWEYVEAESEKEAIEAIKEDKEWRLSFELEELMDYQDTRPEPIKIEEDPESYRAVPSLVRKGDPGVQRADDTLRRINRKDYWKKK